MSILLLCLEDKELHTALFDGNQLNEYPIDELDGLDAQDFEEGNPYGDAIDNIFARLGLDSISTREADWIEHRTFGLPVSISKIITLKYSG